MDSDCSDQFCRKRDPRDLDTEDEYTNSLHDSSSVFGQLLTPSKSNPYYTHCSSTIEMSLLRVPAAS